MPLTYFGGNLKEGKAINLVILLGFLVDFYFCVLYQGGGGVVGRGRRLFSCNSVDELTFNTYWFS